jgi:hypothetical protein
MMKTVALLPLLLSACVTDIDSVDGIDGVDEVDRIGSSTALSIPPTDPPEPVPPHIIGMSWHWNGCGPSASPLPFSLTVNVKVEEPTFAAIKIDGQATGCEAFSGNGAVAVCYPLLQPAPRELTVHATNPSGGADKASTRIIDCTDGQWPSPTAADPS